MELTDAKWIWCPKAEKKNAYVHFYCTFDKKSAGEPVELKITAEGQYIAQVNGKIAAWGQYPDYPFYKVYQTHNITKFCLDGKNELLITVYYQGEDSLTHRRETPGVLFLMAQGESVLCRSTSEVLCAPDKRYQSGEIEKISNQLGYGFCYRHNQRAFSIEDSMRALEIEKEAKLMPRELPQLCIEAAKKSMLQSQGVFWEKKSPGKTAAWGAQYAALGYRELEDLTEAQPPVFFPNQQGARFIKTEKDAHGIYLLLDLKQEQSGLLKLEAQLPEGTKVLIGFGEHLTDLRVRTWIDGRNFCASYICLL